MFCYPNLSLTLTWNWWSVALLNIIIYKKPWSGMLRSRKKQALLCIPRQILIRLFAGQDMHTIVVLKVKCTEWFNQCKIMMWNANAHAHVSIKIDLNLPNIGWIICHFNPKRWSGYINWHISMCFRSSHIDGLVQKWRNSSALIMELHLSCTNLSACS